jgi:hypothetical protein
MNDFLICNRLLVNQFLTITIVEILIEVTLHNWFKLLFSNHSLNKLTFKLSNQNQ